MGSNQRKAAHRRKEYMILGVFFVVVAIGATVLQSQVVARSKLRAYFVLPNGTKSSAITLRIASTPSERAKGLMYEKHLARDEGMVFIFPDEKQRHFWMKNTPLALDMVFIAADKRVQGVVANTTPQSEQRYSVAGASKYVVELNAGTAATLGVVAGSTITFDGPIPRAVTDTAGTEAEAMNS